MAAARWRGIVRTGETPSAGVRADERHPPGGTGSQRSARRPGRGLSGPVGIPGRGRRVL